MMKSIKKLSSDIHSCDAIDVEEEGHIMERGRTEPIAGQSIGRGRGRKRAKGRRRNTEALR